MDESSPKRKNGSSLNGKRNSWSRYFEALQVFVHKKGKLPTTKDVHDSLKIGSWLANQKHRFKNLAKNQQEVLSSLLIEFNKPDTFSTFFVELKSFQKKNNGAWPTQERGATHLKLARKMVKIRQKFKNGKLSESQFEALSEIGFPFEEEWNQRFDDLCAFKKAYGKWPVKNERDGVGKLATWCINQRHLFNKGSLSAKRIELLKGIHFDFSPHDTEWQKNFEGVIRFVSEFGRFPARSETIDGIKIGGWCVTQRTTKKKKILSDFKIKLLNSIGFKWELSPLNARGFRGPDLIGMKFSRLTIIGISHLDREGKRIWSCLCECGTLTTASSHRLRTGKKQSCKCLMIEKARSRMASVQAISAEKRKLAYDDVQARINRVHGDSEIVMLRTSFSGVHRSARFYHRIYGEWTTRPVSVLSGSSHPIAGRIAANVALESKRLTEDLINERLSEHIKLKPGTFTTTHKKATFIDLDFGEWQAICSNVLCGSGHPQRGKITQVKKMEETNLRKYGVKYVAQVAEFALRAADKQRKIVQRAHWKTNEKLLCQGGWETAVVDFLNFKRIEFLWQPKVFDIPLDIMRTPKGNQVTYRPDLFLIEDDLWVEIKGYFREDAMRKWSWFSESYPNSKLWDFSILKNLGVFEFLSS